MAPRPELKSAAGEGVRRVEAPLPGDEIVISGISGKFPESDSVRDFMHNLYNKVDMVTEDDRRWTVYHPDIPNATGKISGMDHFDAQFFGVHYRQAECLDPMGRMLLENAYGAVFDAGVNPRELRNSKTGVYVAVATSDAEKTWFYQKNQISGLGLTGTARAMLSNRISYWLGTHGPSYTVHAECSSSMLALEHAYNAIRTGLCDSAIVGGINICVNPFISLQIGRMGLLSDDGKTKCFDKNADGYGRSETISAILLQKARDAKRAYVEIVHAKSNCDGFSGNRVSFPDRESQRAFLQEFYDEVDVLPAQVKYVEAFGAGQPDMDKNELDAIDDVFCKNRQDPVLVGSVKSNMGHAEAASGVAAAAKICLAYHKGSIAPNLHYDSQREDVVGVREGRIRIVTEPMPFSGGYSAASSYSFTGANVHVLFKGLPKKQKRDIQDDLPRLIVLAGRSEDKLKTIFKDLASQPLDMEQISLLHKFHEVPIAGHVFRGYGILKPLEDGTVRCTQTVDYFPGLKRPVWFVYSGMGSQWSGMGTQLMRIPIFAAAVERCRQALAPKGVDLMRILTDPDPSVYDNILHSFVGIAAVQIGLTDILTALGIRPDNIIGHSVGELGCAYADGCFTAEEMILAAYSRGLVSKQTSFIRGSMAAVGIGYDQIKSMCPPEIEVACHNGPDSCTISGPADAMKSFVGSLTARGIFAKEVPCSNIAYHSRYIAEAGPSLLKLLQEVVKNPKPISSRWLSTSIPQNKWDQPLAKLCSAEYHTNNLLNPVLFEETSRQIPSNAITIEIAPHGLLQAILRRSLHADCINVPLTKRGHKDNVEFLLDAIGKLYMSGLSPKLANIYPPVQFPVSAETSLLSHLVGWEHSEKWISHIYIKKNRVKAGERHFVMSTYDEEHQFMAGCVVNGANIFPAAGYLVLAWETLGMMLGTHYSQLSVVFEDVRFESDTVVHAHRTLDLVIMVNKASGKFEITSEGGVVASGRVTVEKKPDLRSKKLVIPADEDSCQMALSSEDVYRILNAKGYSYKDAFRSIESASISCNKGRVQFRDNWVTFLDGILQMNVLRSPADGISKPKLIRKLTIDTSEYADVLNTLSDTKIKSFDVTINDLYEFTRCGGVELEGLVLMERDRCPLEPPLLESYTFVPYFGAKILEEKCSLRIHLLTAFENTNVNVFKVAIISMETDGDYAGDISNVLKNLKIKHEIQDVVEVDNNMNTIHRSNLVVTSNASKRKNVMEKLLTLIDNNGFILSFEKMIPKKDAFDDRWDLISAHEHDGGSSVLLKKRSEAEEKKQMRSDAGGGTKYITVKSSSKFSWLQLVKAERRTCDRLVLVSECDPCAGLLGVFNCLRREPEGHVLSLLLIDDCNAPAFRPDLPLYQQQLARKLAFNVYRNGEWGSHQYLPLPPMSVQSEHVYLASQLPEDISSLAWLQGPLTLDFKPQHPNNILVQVYYSAVSYIDAQIASGRLHNDVNYQAEPSDGYGMDFCGRTVTGERVMGLLAGGAISSLVEADVDMLWPVPPHWSMQDAATVPLAYANAFYCLEFQAGIEPGMTVLIHSGSGALGQAAINICLSLGCEVFTTVSSLKKKQLLLKIIPGLKESNIGYSRSAQFEDLIMKATKDGCDIIINTLSGEPLKASMRCLRLAGTLINMNKDDISKNNPFGMTVLKLCANFRTANVANLFLPRERARRNKIQQLIATGIATGAVRPLSRVVLSASDASRAFRFTSSGRHVGKVLVQLRQEELRPLVTPSRVLTPAQPRYLCSGDGVYIVVLSDYDDILGLDLADWLVQRGATDLLLHSLAPSPSPYQTFRMRSWRRRGVKVKLSSENLQTQEGCRQLLTDAAKQAPVLGLFVAPRPSHRAHFEHAQAERFARDYSEKALVVMNLDSASRTLCPQLREFVVVSSAAAGRGAAGYSSGAHADSVLERVCEERAKLGLPALALQCQEHTDELISTEHPDRRLSTVQVTQSLDQLLPSKYKAAVCACSQVEKNTSTSDLLHTVSNIVGVENIIELGREESLKDYGVDISTAKEIQCMLERRFQIFCTPERIVKFTIADIIELQSEFEQDQRVTKGLDMFFNYVDPEEFNAGNPLVRMPTLLSDGCETEEEMYQRANYLVMIPGMEGHSSVFLTIAQRLKMNAFACNLEFDHFDDNIESMAARLSQVIVQKLRPDGTFMLLGYSFGVTVALEVAANLEQLGYTGKVFCLDGSPRMFAALLEAQLGHLSERRLQDEVIVHMFRVMSASDSGEDELRHALAAESSWERKLDACVRRLRGRVQFSFQYQRSLVAMAYARIRQARAYSDATLLSRPLRSELILLKATRRPPSLSAAADSLGADLGLGVYSREPLRVYELDCDHAGAPAHLLVSDILNRHLADLTHFKTLNLCDTYVLNDIV